MCGLTDQPRPLPAEATDSPPEDVASDRDPTVHYVGDRDIRCIDPRQPVATRCGVAVVARHATNWPPSITCTRCRSMIPARALDIEGERERRRLPPA